MSDSLLAALTTAELIRQARDHWPDHPLVIFDQQQLNYREAEHQSALLARRLLYSGIGKGNHVGLLLANSCEFVVSWLAITRIGAVGVPISTFSTERELRQLVCHADLHALIMQPSYLKHDYLDRLEQTFPSLSAQASSELQLEEAPFLRNCWVWDTQAPPWAVAIDISNSSHGTVSAALLASAENAVMPSDHAAIIYTSGSTAEPKGVVHTQASLLRQSIKQAREKGYTGSDRIFSSMPFFWVGGLSYKLLPALQSGAAVLGCSSANPDDILRFLEQHRVSFFLGWPHAAQALEQSKGFQDYDLSAMRGGYLYGAMPADQRPSSIAAITNALGMTETAGPHTQGHLSPLPNHLHGSFGKAAEGMEYRIVDVDSGRVVEKGKPGELWVRGDTLMAGLYKREPDAVFTTDGWYPTRDLVHMREGHLFFEGRCDDVVKIKGANVSPREVEDLLCRHPDIAQAFVSGVMVHGKLVLGAVLAVRSDQSLALKELVASLRSELSAYKVPKHYLCMNVSELPYRSSGKLDRRALLEKLAQDGTAIS